MMEDNEDVISIPSDLDQGNENEYLAFVEGGHYSPRSSRIVAETIFNNINFD